MPNEVGDRGGVNARMLTAPYETLTLGERAAALLAARVAGRHAAEGPVGVEELENPGSAEYFLAVVMDAHQSGSIDDATLSRWRDGCGGPQLLRDPRVQAFLFGWHERAVEVLAELATLEMPDHVRAQWFLGGVDA